MMKKMMMILSVLLITTSAFAEIKVKSPNGTVTTIDNCWKEKTPEGGWVLKCNNDTAYAAVIKMLELGWEVQKPVASKKEILEARMADQDKQAVLELMGQIPDGVSVEESIERSDLAF